MKSTLLACCVLLSCATVSCSNKEHIFEGMYKGMSSAEESKMAGHPSYDPLQNQAHEKPSYQEYKRERELEIQD